MDQCVAMDERQREPFPSASLSMKEFYDLKMGLFERWVSYVCVCVCVCVREL
jgi:hypothetical protein